MTAPEPPDDEAPDTTLGLGAIGGEVFPERAAAYVDPVTGESGLTFAELAARYPDVYPSIL